MQTAFDAGLSMGGLPLTGDTPIPAKPDDIATNEQAKRAWRRAAAQTYAANIEARSARLLTAKTLFVASHFRDTPFYFPMQLDFRGRVYCVPYFLTPQGQSQARGLLRFAYGKPLTSDDQVAWFEIHGANCFGIDKVSMAERRAWVAANRGAIGAVFSDPEHNQWWAEADKPWEFLAWCLEYGAYLDSPASFVSKLPIAMDGSNNGLQLFSLLLKDRVGGEATNCVPSSSPRDIYQDVADKVTEALRLQAADEVQMHSEGGIASAWLALVNGRVPRECTKRPVMVLPYGGTIYSCQTYVIEWFQGEVRARKRNPFGTQQTAACRLLARLVWDAIEDTVQSARTCMTWLQQTAAACHAAGLPIRWTSPSGFPVRQAYRKTKSLRIETRVGDVIRQTQLHQPTDTLDRRKQINGISPNFIHSLDAAALVKTVNAAARRGVDSFAMIHDSYGVLAADAPVMARTLREVYVEMFSSDILSNFREQIQLQLGTQGTVPEVPKCGDLRVLDVLDSEYFFA
jgi:DNA-directed RNA polymerase